jgi:uncharacterized spore protein YtfJ
MDIKENLKAIFDEMEEFLTTKAVIGEPIEVGNVTIIPVVDVAFGVGTGGGGGEDAKNINRQGGGAGMGAKISPSAVIVIKEGDISVIPLNSSAGIDKLIDMIPGLLKKIKSKGEGKGKKAKDQVTVR